MKKIFIAQLLFVLALFFAKDSVGFSKPVPALPPLMSDSIVLDSDQWTTIVNGVPGELVQVMDLIAPGAESNTGIWAVFQVMDANGQAKYVYAEKGMSIGVVLRPGDVLQGKLINPSLVPTVGVFWAAKLAQ